MAQELKGQLAMAQDPVVVEKVPDTSTEILPGAWMIHFLCLCRRICRLWLHRWLIVLSGVFTRV